MKKVYILHRWSGGPEHDWYPWLKHQLESRGFEVFVPEMPNTDYPVIEERVSFLQNLIPQVDENTYFICHSIGCQTFMRYIETLPSESKIGGAIFVAGWIRLDNLEDEETTAIAMPWMNVPINFEKVKTISPDIKVLFSSNEPYGLIEENKKVFEEKLGAQVTILENKGHFTEGDGCIELPEVLTEFEKLSNE